MMWFSQMQFHILEKEVAAKYATKRKNPFASKTDGKRQRSDNVITKTERDEDPEPLANTLFNALDSSVDNTVSVVYVLLCNFAQDDYVLTKL